MSTYRRKHGLFVYVCFIQNTHSSWVASKNPEQKRVFSKEEYIEEYYREVEKLEEKEKIAWGLEDQCKGEDMEKDNQHQRPLKSHMEAY